MVLKAYKFTPNCMLYGETGTTDMATKKKKRMMNFWLKQKNCTNGKFSNVLCNLL